MLLSRVDADEAISWIEPRLASVDYRAGQEQRGVPVVAFVPTGYARYLRVFHRWYPWNIEEASESPATHQADRAADSPKCVATMTSGGGRAPGVHSLPSDPEPKTWAELAASIGAPYGPSITRFRIQGCPPTWTFLGRPGTGTRWDAPVGSMDDASRRALAAVLERFVQAEPVLFSFGLAAQTSGQDTLVYRAPVAAVDEVRRAAGEVVRATSPWHAGPLTGPEYWWTPDRSWIVVSDYDSESTLVGSNPARTPSAAEVENQ